MDMDKTQIEPATSCLPAARPHFPIIFALKAVSLNALKVALEYPAASTFQPFHFSHQFYELPLLLLSFTTVISHKDRNHYSSPRQVDLSAPLMFMIIKLRIGVPY